jgi:Protein of unknown function (DUF998)
MLNPGRHGHGHPGRLRVAVPDGHVPWRGFAAPIGVPQSRGSVIRRDLVRALGACAVLAYNWWILVPMRPGLLRSPDELFSNLEVTGHPFATLMQRADLLSGLLMLAAFVVAGSGKVKAGRPDWLCMMIFSLAGVAGGLFPETCADGISESCRQLEMGLRLPLVQYLHIAAAVVEFGSITAALAFAVVRTWPLLTPIARTYRGLVWAAVVAYPLLGVACLTDRLGAIIQAVFFIGFSVMVIAELLERTRLARQAPERSCGH